MSATRKDFAQRASKCGSKANGADTSALVPTTIDLTSDDGLKDYGETTQKIFLLTCDMYRKYRSIIPNLDDWWWLATAYSTESNGYTSYARNVFTDGALNSVNADYGSTGVRPAFYLKFSILESLSPSLSEFTTEELLREVLRRIEKTSIVMEETKNEWAI